MRTLIGKPLSTSKASLLTEYARLLPQIETNQSERVVGLTTKRPRPRQGGRPGRR